MGEPTRAGRLAGVAAVLVAAVGIAGAAVASPDWVDIGTLTEEAWTDVETEDTTLSVTAAGGMEADPNRTHDLFANLFRNAIEHTDGTVAVTVGARFELTDVALRE